MREPGISNPEEKKEYITYTDEQGNYSFQGVGKKRLRVEPEPRFYWTFGKRTIDLERLEMHA